MPENELKLGITVLASGSKGNSCMLQYGDDAILIDAGLCCRELKARMHAVGCHTAPKAILVTHEHTDHVCGISAIANNFAADVYCTRLCSQRISTLKRVKTKCFIFMPGSEFSIGPFRIHPFPISHDSQDAVGYTVEVEGKKFAIATDLGIATQMVEFNLRNCDAIIMESNHDLAMLANSARPWTLKQRILSTRGHLSNVQFANLFEKVVAPNTKVLVLGHISQECNTYPLVEDNARTLLERLGRQDINLNVALQDEPLNTIWV